MLGKFDAGRNGCSVGGSWLRWKVEVELPRDVSSRQEDDFRAQDHSNGGGPRDAIHVGAQALCRYGRHALVLSFHLGRAFHNVSELSGVGQEGHERELTFPQ